MAEYKLTTPLKEEDVRKLNLGDTVYITGIIFTARDEAHERLIEYAEKGEKVPVNLEGAVIYHAGPIVRKKDGEWEIVAAGPTTSSRMNKATPKVLEKYPIRMLIGKGGMSQEVLEAMKKHGVVYCQYTGGAAVLAAKNIKRVIGVEWLDLGIPEALWILEVENFGPLTVTMDAKGNSIYEKLKQEQKKILERLLSQL
ncbi:MAG: fumarate hydratase subunit beta [Archaeoglobaceae archaeon]|nr:fumarate hydratase subunit beta [Archaeoglobaceae archaeon]